MSDRSKMVGRKLPSFSFRVEQGKIKELAQAIGDDNPVYYSREKALEEGYRDVIAPPTYGTVIDHWGENDFTEMCALLEMNPVMVLHGEQEYHYWGEINQGDEITASTVIAGYEEKPKMFLFVLETEYYNQRGEKVILCRKTLVERKGNLV